MKTPQDFCLSDLENERIFEEEIKPEIFSNCDAIKFPTAIIFGGQPGSGKTKVVELAELELKNCGGAVSIIGDDLRPYHPKHDYLMQQDDNTAALFTQHDAGRWVEKAIEYAKNNHFNIVIESTMRVPDTVIRTLIDIKKAGYKTEARALAVHKKLSWQGVLQRYEQQRFYRGSGRMTPPLFHEAAYSGMLESLFRIETEKRVDKVILYKRGAVVLYENLLEEGMWKYPPQARLIVEEERNREWTMQEKQEYAYNFDKLLELIKLPERKASLQEIKTMEELRNQAHFQLRSAKKLKIKKF